MKEIILDNDLKKFHYYFSIGLSILFIYPIIHALILMFVGRNRSENTIKKKNVLNKTYQKYIYISGFFLYFFIIIIILYKLGY